MAEFVMAREGSETWREAAARYARPHGLEREVTKDFDTSKRLHPDQDEAAIAWDACHGWDVLPCVASAEDVTGWL